MVITERYLGDSRSKKKICLYGTDDLQYIYDRIDNYDIQDHFDAVCLFEFMSLVAWRQYGEFSEEFRQMHTMRLVHGDFISKESFSQEMASLGLVTSIDIRNYGESLVKHFLRD